MATLSERLTKRFRNVPGVTTIDVADWLTEAQLESELIEGTDVNTDNAIIYLAFALGCEVIAADAARYFKYGDGEENVDKSAVFGNYMALAKDARKNYRKHVRGRSGATQSHVGRADDR
ncbi:hypothetical protein GJU41_12000 [Bacillus idriensis]|uniref:Uncharacterized protein n=1 Tax=Metabacillus idriensis TaxID=324768 RepID=A0A6I2MCE4_9BACI|nr:hypothetical protein [Metabacillus idriensis]MRX54696.1 hypothetical protein [Metabacillus idriensis]